MNRYQTWKKQGRYRSFITGKPMLLVLDPKTGATVLEPLTPEKHDLSCYHNCMVAMLKKKSS